MKKSKRRLLQLALVALVFGGCEKDYNYVVPKVTVDKNAASLSFASEIQPILNLNCATSTCHDGTHAPDLRASSSYSELIAGAYVNTGSPDQSELYRRITLPSSDADFMPDGKSPLSSSDITKILTWI